MLSKNIKIFNVIIVFIFLLFTTYSACLNTPSYINVKSGSYDLGDFDTNFLQSGNSIYIKEDLHTYPLKIEFNFENIDDDCFSSKDDMEMRIFSSGMFVNADSMNKNNNKTVFSFEFDLNTQTPSSFTSTYTVNTKVDNTQSDLNFKIDNNPPEFTNFFNIPENTIIAENTTVKIDYQIQDLGSGLKNLQIFKTTGSETIDFSNRNKTYEGSIEENLVSTTKYTLITQDKLSNRNQKNITYIVDNEPPLVSDFRIESYTTDSMGNRKVSFSTIVEDISYSDENNKPQINGDFREINNEDSNKIPTCSKIEYEENKYKCYFNEIDINLLDSTKTVPIEITAQDTIGNQKKYTFKREIFYDTKGPRITDFYLINSVKEKNGFNALDENVSIIVNFIDESLNSKNDIRLLADFDGLEQYIIPECKNITNNRGECVWNLGNSISKYSGVEKDKLLFKLIILDKYGNPTNEEINITINNKKPEITKIDLDETENIKDGIIKSGEEFNFKIYIKDDNLKFHKDLIFGDFSNVDFNDGMHKKAGNCHNYNKTVAQCEFKNIKAENGYINTSIYFYVIDTTGNIKKQKYPIEIFAIGDEVFSSFKIPKVNITNPLDKNLLTKHLLTAWFEGEIKLEGNNSEVNSDIKIINYQLKSCNDSNMNPILLGERELYPSNIQLPKEDNIEPDKNFALRVEVKEHPNKPDLKNKTMKCTMSILKRDNTTVYSPELVDFKVAFSYYELPFDDLLSANAQNILNDIDDVEIIGGNFDDIYDIYEKFNEVCTVINRVNSVIGTVTQVWTAVSTVLNNIPVTKGIAKAGDAGILTIEGILDKMVRGLGTAVNKICLYVACDYENLLGDWGGINKVLNGVNSMGGILEFPGMCTTEDLTPNNNGGGKKK